LSFLLSLVGVISLTLPHPFGGKSIKIKFISMKKHFTLFLLFALGLQQLSMAQVVPGTTCDTAFPIECGIVYSNNTMAVLNDNVTSGAIACSGVGSGGQTWYSYTAPDFGVVTISTCGSAMDTRIHVFTGSCGNLNCYVQNDDACGLQSIVTFEVIAGETYLIRAGGFGSMSGAFNLIVSCDESVTGCMDPNASNFDPLANAPDTCQYTGCTDPAAANFNPYATIDDGTCIGWTFGCTNPMAVNYNSAANADDGSCVIEGCTDAAAQNFNAVATIDDGSCTYCNGEGSTMASLYICTFSNGNQVELQIVDDQGNEVYYASGLNNGAIVYASICLQPGVCYTANMMNNTGPFGWYNGYFWVNAGGDQIINAHPSANAQFATVQFSIDGTCGPVFGCTDPAATNYNAEANMEDGSCVYPTVGCTDPSAVNFDPLAAVDNGTCFYMNDCLGSVTEFILNPGMFANEASYVIYDELGNTIAAGSGATTQYGCLLDGCYTVAMFDSFGDGWDGGGYLDVVINGETTNSFSLATGFEGADYFGINAEGCVPVIAGCTDPTALNYNTLANEDDGSCEYPLNCTDNLVTIQISTSNWGSEIGWSLVDASGVEVAAGSGYSSWGWYTEYACVADGCYQLVLNDSWGDGWNGAYYMLSTNSSYYEGSLYYGSTGIDMIGVNSDCGVIAGCTDVEALNYNPQATFDDGSCLFNSGAGMGITNGLEMEFALYPNPTTGGIIVSATSIDPLKTITVNVYGAEGRLVRSATHAAGSENAMIEQDLTTIPAGYYFVELLNGNSRLVKPLVKQ
jgi:hypothetical protein